MKSTTRTWCAISISIVVLVAIPGLGFLFRKRERAQAPHGLNDVERSLLHERASAGDHNAALQLANFYSFHERNPAEELKWMTVAASHGSIAAKHYLKELLNSFEEPHRTYLATAIYEFVEKEQGIEKSQELRRELESSGQDLNMLDAQMYSE